MGKYKRDMENECTFYCESYWKRERNATLSEWTLLVRKMNNLENVLVVWKNKVYTFF